MFYILRAEKMNDVNFLYQKFRIVGNEMIISQICIFYQCFVKICATSNFHRLFIIHFFNLSIFKIKMSPFCLYFHPLFIEINLNLDRI